MHQTFLLLGYDGPGRVDEIIGTFDTSELAKEFVASGIGQDVDWIEPVAGSFIGGRWQIITLPHNGSDLSDWADPR
jgi:hypothetical protein